MWLTHDIDVAGRARMATCGKSAASARSPIAFGGAYLKCGVSTCNRKRFQLYFCSDSCWDAHNPDQNHRNPSYTEHRAPAGPAVS